MPFKAAKVLIPLGASLAFHAALGASMARLSGRRAFERQGALQIAVVDKPPPEKPQPPKQVVPMKRVARAPKQDLPPPRTIVPPTAAPPPPTHEAPNSSPMVITGI